MATASILPQTPEAAGTIATAGPVRSPLAHRAVAGRYGVQVVIGHDVSTFRTDSLTAAQETYDRFCRANAQDRDAQAGIYDYRAFKFLAAFRGGNLRQIVGAPQMAFLPSEADRNYYRSLVL